MPETKRRPGRPKTKIAVNQDPNSTDSKTLSPEINQAYQEVSNRWTKIFNQYGNSADYTSAMQSWYTSNPYVQNQRLKNLKSMPVFQDRASLESDLENPGNNEMALREHSWALMSGTYAYYKMMKLYSDILTYNNYAYPCYVDAKEMDTPRFKSDSKVVHMLLDKIQPSYTFRRIVLECLEEGKRAYVYRLGVNTITGSENIDYFLLQELPSDWWKPVEKSNESYYVPSFNFTYFWQPGVSVKQFPPEFEEYFAEVMGFSSKDEKTGVYKVDDLNAAKSKGFDYEYNNSTGEWYLWHVIDDGFVFSVDESNPWISPVFTGLFLSASDLQAYYTLQTQLTSIPLYGLVTGEIPIADDGKSGFTPNATKITPDMALGFEAKANSMLPPGVSFLSAPFTDMKLQQFNEQVNSSVIYGRSLSQYLNNAGLGALYPTSDRPSVAQVQSSQKIESRFADVFYKQFENFLYCVFQRLYNLQNEDRRLKYIWKFRMFGNVFEDKDKRAEIFQAINSGQSYLLPEYIAYSGLNIESANCLVDYVKSFKIYEKFEVLTSAFNAKQSTDGAEKKNGRPEVSMDSIDNDNTAASKDSGDNLGESKNFSALLQSEEFQEAVSEIVEGNENGN